MQNLLHKLKIPPEYSRYDTLQQDPASQLYQTLDDWEDSSTLRLSELASHLSAAVTVLSLDEQSLLVLYVSQYDGDGPWVSDLARVEAQKILSTYITPTAPLLLNILSTLVRPIFQSHLHPSLNPDTGRKLARAAGGPSASQDLYTSQSWKEECPGIGDVVLWIVKQIESEDYEKLWHLIIPPTMTLLDDYDARYKVQGILIVAEMLKRVPAELLKRTGVNRLVFSSLKNTLTFLNNPKTPYIIRSSVPTIIALIDVVTPRLMSTDKGKQRFDDLSSILGDGIIGSVWMYASRDAPTIKASIDVLPLLVESTGIGSVRFLKAMLHQLLHLLLPPEPGVDLSAYQAAEEDELKLTTLRALITIIRVCEPRIGFWKGTILDGIARCWVYEIEKRGSEEIKAELRTVCAELKRCSPSVENDEFRRLLNLDPMFCELIEFYEGTER